MICSRSPQVILNSLFFKYDLKKAIKEPRFHNQLKPNITMVEQGFEKVAAVTDGTETHLTLLVPASPSALFLPPERHGRSGPEEPRDPAVAVSRLCGPGGGPAGGAAVRRVRPQERRLPGGLLRAARSALTVVQETRSTPPL